MSKMMASPMPRPALLLFAAGAIVALSHLANEWASPPPPWDIVWKSSGIVILGLFASVARAPLAALGLFFSAAGDALLEIDGLFIFGMGAFGLAHMFYAAIFIGLIRGHGLNRRDIPVAVLVVAISGALLAWLLPAMGDMAIPGVAYFGIISLMTASALISKAPMTARLGAILFMVSDSLLSAGMFRDAAILPGAVWVTYALAQIMLAWGFAKLRQALDRVR